MGAINIVELNDGPRVPSPKKITLEKGIYREPSFSSDWQYSLYSGKESGNGQQGFVHTLNPASQQTIPAGGGEMTMITDEGAFPKFSPDDNRNIFIGTGGYIFGAINKSYKKV
ncbi:MAG: hypothetical protein U5N86_10615 [Planctomycetota bacterium]|nr:hypothetical protein [Planctomycetota bacterium]